jgi:succinate-acetate transporter protein
MAATTPGTPVPVRHDGHRTIEGWRDNTRVVLQPIAAPSILGLFGLAAATFVVGAWLADWYGGAATPGLLFPLVAILGGVAQFAAAMWAFRARDGLASAVHGTWSSFWMAYGILYLLGTVGVLALPAGTFTELGYWLTASVAATAVNLAFTALLTALWVGAGLLAVGYLSGVHGWVDIGGWVWVAAAIAAWYTASAMMIEDTTGRVVLPLGDRGLEEEPLPGGIVHHPIEFEYGEPGVRHGQ